MTTGTAYETSLYTISKETEGDRTRFACSKRYMELRERSSHEFEISDRRSNGFCIAHGKETCRLKQYDTKKTIHLCLSISD